MKRSASWCSCTIVLCASIISGCAAAPKKETHELRADATPLERKLADDPNDRQVNLALGEDAESHGDYLRAEQYYLRAEALGAAPAEIVPRVLRVLTASHRYDEALERCQRRLQAKPDDRITRYVEATLFVALERPREAERDLNALAQSQPKDARAYLALGRLYRDGNDPTRARAMFKRYLQLAPAGEDAAAVRFELASEGEPIDILDGGPPDAAPKIVPEAGP